MHIYYALTTGLSCHPQHSTFPIISTLPGEQNKYDPTILNILTGDF